jgi:tetratricopeptide (TPR) repeat protein
VERGWSRLALAEWDGAVEALEHALTLSPEHDEALVLLAWAQVERGALSVASELLGRVLTRAPHHALGRMVAGFGYLRQREYPAAIEQLSLALRATGDKRATLYAHLYLGVVYREREMFDDAEHLLRRALELGPNLIQAWYELGDARWTKGDRDGAADAWRQGSAANKFNPWSKRCADRLAEQVGDGPRDRLSSRNSSELR